jgi:S-adenosyl-L-methionine hydrolase (adenosine-forming)
MAIVLFTDFGSADIYVGQVKALLHERAPAQPLIDLCHDLPAFNICAGAHLLAACVDRFSAGTVFLAVVDPGVGTERDAILVRADDRWLVGPDNGLLSVCAARARSAQCWSIVRQSAAASVSFHGRDVFAPIAGAIASGSWPEQQLRAKAGVAVDFGGAALAEVIYIDHFGNVFTGIPARTVGPDASLAVAGERVAYRRVFAEAAAGVPFWYENSLGLVEIAVNQGSAAKALGLQIGDAVIVEGDSR